MGKIADFAAFEAGARVLKDLEDMRKQSRALIGGMINLAVGYRNLIAQASDNADRKAFDDRLAESIAMAKADVDALDPATRAILDKFIDDAFGKQNK